MEGRGNLRQTFLMPSALETEIREVDALIDELRRADTGFHVFGADSHRYRIGSTLSEAQIAAFEAQHEIRLPEDYRLYLQLVGDGGGLPTKEDTRLALEFLNEGLSPEDAAYLHSLKPSGGGPRGVAGAGPDYGLAPLQKTTDYWKQSEFPFVGDMPLPFDEWLFLDDEDDLIPGALELSEQGCGGSTFLIVKGQAHGTIWNGYGSSRFSPTGFTFNQWMRRWAEKQLVKFHNLHLVANVRLGMTKEEVVGATNEFWAERENAGTILLENPTMSIQLTLSQERRVIQIRDYLFNTWTPALPR